MALRASNSSTATSPHKNPHHPLLPGLQLFWPDANTSPALEWEIWIDLFAVAVMSKYLISIEELTRTVNVYHPRVKALIGDMPEKTVEKKVVP